MKSLVTLLPYFRPYRTQLGIGLACILASSAIGLAAPLIIGKSVDAVIRSASSGTLLRFAAALILATLLKGVFQYSQRFVLVRMSRSIEFDLRNRFFEHLQTLEPRFFEKAATGDLMARATNDIQAIRMVCGPAIMYGANTVFTAIGATIFMLDIHPELTAVALASLPLVALVTQYFGKKIHHLFLEVQQQFSDLTSKVQENLAGARVIRSYVREEEEKSVFSELNLEQVERNRRLIGWTSAFHPLLQGVIGISFAAVLWYGGTLLLDQVISIGEFVAFNLFLNRLIWPMIAVGWVINLAQRAAASMARLNPIMATKPAIRDTQNSTRPLFRRARICFDDLDFRYPDTQRPALQGIDVEIEDGSTVAIVGRTGSGKSTLLSLLPRLIDPDPGTLEIDGVDIRHYPLALLRQAIAVVPQESFLFSTTIRENIKFGAADPSKLSEQAIEEAATIAGLDADLRVLGAGLDTVIGERGITLSGGQKQRVALARALVRKPRILLLDDCLSAVDTETEEKILGGLGTFMDQRTVIFVSHRVSAARLADRIMVLDQGSLVESGTHTELIGQQGFYARLHRLQALREELAAV